VNCFEKLCSLQASQIPRQIANSLARIVNVFAIDDGFNKVLEEVTPSSSCRKVVACEVCLDQFGLRI